jgi:adenine C2-methylase RlmN of 23S rRNA A2503 and tRNA A37
VGCQMGCTFCATGTMGLTADLTGGEIVEQLVHARGIVPVSNVVFMGMGEPLNNYAAVRAAVSMMTDSAYFALRKSAVTVSTVGVIPRINQLADDLPGVLLALSLHAPTQELRQTIVPSAKAYKLDRLIACIEAYVAKTKQRVFIEYVMLGPDVNCTAEHARQLGVLLQSLKGFVVINLIPWNPILSPGMAFAAPEEGSLSAFHAILREEYGLPVTVRQEKGQDVAAACGQLVLEHGGKACSSGGGVGDVEDLGRAPHVAACGGSR